MTMLSDLAGAEGKFLRKMVSFTSIEPERESADGYGVYRVKGKSGGIFVKYWLNGKNIISSLDSEEFHSWLCVHGTDDMTKSKVHNAVYKLRNLATLLRDELPERDLYNRIGYEELSDKSEKLYLCLHNRENEVVEIDGQGWRVIPEMTAGVLFENAGMMESLFRPERGGSISELREFVNVSEEHFMLVVGWLLVALNVKGTMDCPILWINAPKGTGKTTATKYLKRLIDPDTGGTIAPVAKIRDFAASVSSRFVVAVDNLSKISLKMSDTYCRAVTGDTISRRKLFTDNTVNNVNLHARLIMNGMNYAPARSDLQDRCFQIKLERLGKKTRKTNEELEQMFEQRGPHILGALLDALSAGLRNREYEPELGVNMRMRDACCFIMRVANTGVLPFSEGEFRNVLRQQKEYAESADKEPLHSNTILSLICDMANEKCEMNEDVEEVEVWNDSTGKLLEELSKRASKLERAGEKGLLKDIPKSPQKLGAELSKGKSALEENSIYVERGNSPQSKRKSSRRMTRIVYRPIEDYEDSDCEKMESETDSSASGLADEVVDVKDTEKKNGDEIEMINEVSEASDGVLVMTLKGEHVVSTILSSQVSSMNETEEKMRYLPSLLKYVPPTIISGVRGIGPNSGVPLGKLTCLTKEEIRCAVMSNVFIVPYVRINTVIWDNWDIFYRRKYIWTVVRSRPGSVKILLPFPELRFLLCEPTGENGNYRAVILSKWGRPRVLLASGSLKEALDACEDKIDDIRYKYEIFVNEANLEIKETYRDDIYLLPMKKAQSITMFQDKRYKFAFKHWYLGMLSLEMVPKAPDFFSNGDRKPIYLNDDLYDNDDYVDFVSEVNKITNEFKINTFRGYRGDWYWNQADYSSHVAIQFIEDIGSFEEKFFKYDCHGFVLGKKNWSKDEKDKFLFFYKNIMQQFFSMREIYVEESLDLLSVSDMKLILTSISRSYIEVDIENAYINLRKKYTRKKSPTKEETKLFEEELKEEKATISKISLDFGILKYIEELKVKSI